FTDVGGSGQFQADHSTLGFSQSLDAQADLMEFDVASVHAPQITLTAQGEGYGLFISGSDLSGDQLKARVSQFTEALYQPTQSDPRIASNLDFGQVEIDSSFRIVIDDSFIGATTPGNVLMSSQENTTFLNADVHAKDLTVH